MLRSQLALRLEGVPAAEPEPAWSRLLAPNGRFDDIRALPGSFLPERG